MIKIVTKNEIKHKTFLWLKSFNHPIHYYERFKIWNLITNLNFVLRYSLNIEHLDPLIFFFFKIEHLVILLLFAMSVIAFIWANNNCSTVVNMYILKRESHYLLSPPSYYLCQQCSLPSLTYYWPHLHHHNSQATMITICVSIYFI